MYRRFFGAKREFSEKERTFFVNVDFVITSRFRGRRRRRPCLHRRRRPLVVQPPTAAEITLVVIDDYQVQGIGVASLGIWPYFSQRRTERVHRRSVAGEHPNAEDVREKRAENDYKARVRHRACRAPTLLIHEKPCHRNRYSGAYPVAVLDAARWVESSSSVCRAIISSSFVGIT